MKTTLILFAALGLSACDNLPGILGILPTPAQICAMSPATQASLAATLNTTVEDITAACEITLP